MQNNLIGLVLILSGVATAVVVAILSLLRKRRPVRAQFKESSQRLLRNGINCFKNNDIQGAIENLNKSIAIDADNGRCHEYLSFAYAQCGHYHLARKHAGLALSFNSDYFAHIANSMFYRYKLEIKKSLEEANKAIQIDYVNYHGHFWAGIASAELGRFAAAFAECEIVRRYEADAATILHKFIKNLENVVTGGKSGAAVESFPLDIDLDDSSFPESSCRAPKPVVAPPPETEKESYSGAREKVLYTAGNSFNGSDAASSAGIGKSLDVTDGKNYDLAYSECFGMLDLTPSATQREIKEAYRSLVKVWHPDRFAHDRKLQEFAQLKLSRINEAYKRLSAGK